MRTLGTRVEVPTPTGQSTVSRLWLAVSGIEAVLAALAVTGDLLIPSLVLVAMAVISLLIRRQGLGSLGLRRSATSHLVGRMFVFAVVWSAVQLSVTMPIATHVSGEHQDLSAFDGLQGNAGMLVALLAAGWALGAFAEELAYRGYLLTRLHGALGSGRAGLVVAVALSSLLFGAAHSEQGWIGALVVTIDGLYFSVLRLHYRTLWASVLAHGFNNTIGFCAFYLVGPVYGFW